MVNNPTSSRVVSFAEASRIVREHAEGILGDAVPPKETVSLLQSLGRVLAEPIAADRDQPPFPRSTRDGFACRAADLDAGRSLKVIGQVRAGETWPLHAGPLQVSVAGETSGLIPAGEAVEIMTGAPVPAGADCVVMLEHVEQNGNMIRMIEGRTAVSPGANIVPAGAEAREGQVILSPGTRISAAQIAVAAAIGAAAINVFARPRVAVLATGDELVELGERPLGAQIRNSNSYSLTAQILTAGGEPTQLPIARDNAADLASLIREGLEAGLLLLSGGVSMGKYDLVEQALLDLGAEFFFTGALIQPGKPIVFGRIRSGAGLKYFFGLPGNPVSTMVTFLLFVEPFLRALGGQPFSGPRFAQARLKTEWAGRSGLTRFIPAKLHSMPEARTVEPAIEPIAWQGSGDLAATSHANCFLLVPSDCATLAAGDLVTALLLADIA